MSILLSSTESFEVLIFQQSLCNCSQCLAVIVGSSVLSFMGLRLSHQTEILLGRNQKLVEENQITGGVPLKEMLRPKTLSFSYFFMTTKGEQLSPLWILYHNRHFVTAPEIIEPASYGLKALKS